MRITFSDAAVEYLTPLLNSAGKQLKFLHNTAGNGCADNGIPTLTLIDEPTSGDVAGEADPLPFYYEPRHEVYYEDHMKIDYKPQSHTFSLKSDAQIYSYNLRFIK